MTPLEELQAAHKRLSELRDRAQQGIWDHMGDFVLLDGDGKFVATGMGVANTDLIVTLHRTIDAQLAIIQRGINLASPVAYGADTSGRVEHFPGVVDHFTLVLARAINGTSAPERHHRGGIDRRGGPVTTTFDEPTMIVPLKPEHLS